MSKRVRITVVVKRVRYTVLHQIISVFSHVVTLADPKSHLTPLLSGEKEHIVPKMFLRKKTAESRNISRLNVFGVAESKSEVGFSKFKMADLVWRT